MTTPPAQRRYDQLVSRIEKIFLDAQQESKKRVNQVILDAYRRIGRQIVEVEQGRQIRAAYGEHLLETLSADLTSRFGTGFSVSNLRYMRQFYLTYRDQESQSQLPWTHYRSLLSIKDPDLREYYERQASKHDWSARDLDRYLKIDKVERERRRSAKDKRAVPTIAEDAPLTVERGQLHTFAMVNSPLGSVIRSPLMIDCGFGIFREMTYHKIGPLKSGDIVTCRQSDDGYTLRRHRDQTASRYFYRAVIERILDAHRLLCVIDAGFSNWTRHTLRLRHIDAPDPKTNRGRKAKSFLVEAVRDCASVVVHTRRMEGNGGYQADVFYLPGTADAATVAAEGRWLNRDLIDRGLATRL